VKSPQQFIRILLLTLFLPAFSSSGVSFDALGEELAVADSTGSPSVKPFSGLFEAQPDTLSGQGGGVSGPVVYAARDSMVYLLDSKKLELWGKGVVSHEGATIKAPKIIINNASSTLTAYGKMDSTKTLVEPAAFSDSGGGFSGEVITYDFDTRKGRTFEASSSSNGIIFDGDDVSRLPDGDLSIRGCTFTTCDDEEPHYWFSASRAHIAPDSWISAWPIVMYVRPEIFSYRLPVIPLLPLPYMVFPISSGRKSGFLIARPGVDGDGFTLSNLGYFWAINDYMDLRLEGDTGANGDWRIGERFRYVKTGDYSGSLTGEYSEEEAGSSWNARIIHSQAIDEKTTLNANMQFIGGERETDLNSIDSETIVTEQSNASASLSRTFHDNNSVAELSYNRSEDLRNNNSSQRVASSYFQNRIYPFLTANDWRSNISVATGVSYAGDFISSGDTESTGNAINANVDVGYYKRYSDNFTALFSQGLSLQNAEPDTSLYPTAYKGARVVMPLRMQATLYRHFNVNPSLTFVHYEPESDSGSPSSTVVFSTDISTRLYATVETPWLEGLVGLKALRHTFVPTVSYTWNPSFSGTDFSYDPYGWYNPLFFGKFEDPSFTGIPAAQSTLGISLKNLLYGKFRGSEYPGVEGEEGSDTSRELLSFTARTEYNAAADELQWAPLTLRAEVNPFPDHFLLSAGGMYDYYSYDSSTGARIERSSSSDGHGLMRFVKGFVNMSMRFEGERPGGEVQGTSTASSAPLVMNANQATFLESMNMGDFSDIDYTLPWQFQMSLLLSKDRTDLDCPAQRVAAETMTLLNAMLKLGLSSHWQVWFNAGYDLQKNEMAFPMVQVHRDLHCWQFAFQWVPFGEFKSYSLQIGLKAPQLRDIRFKQSGTSLGGGS